MKYVVVGAGVIGLTIALELAKCGHEVKCLDAGVPGELCSNYSLGIVYPISPLATYNHLVDLSLEAFAKYPQYLADVKNISGVEVPTTVTNLLQIAFNQSEMNDVLDTANAYQSVGIDVRIVGKEQITSAEPAISDKVVGGSIFKNAIHVYAEDLIIALAKSVESLGGIVVPNCRVRDLKSDNAFCVGVEVDDSDIIPADYVILATGSQSDLLDRYLDVKASKIISPIKGQMLYLSSPNTNNLINNLVYTHYLDIVPRSTGGILVGSTVEDVGYDKSATVHGVSFLLNHLIETLESKVSLEFKAAGVGLRPKTPDDLPIIGRSPVMENVYVSTGHYKNGIYLGPLLAKMLVDDLEAGSFSNVLQRFAPDRFKNAKL